MLEPRPNLALLLLSDVQWRNKLIAYGITAVLGLIAYFVIQRARRNMDRRSVSVKDIKRQAQIIGAVPVVIYGLCVLVLAGILVIAHAPIWTFALGTPVALWALWWMPGSRRRITSQASIFVQGLPARVSAFVADVPGHVRWSPGSVSCVPELSGTRGPRFRCVDRGPDGKEYSGVVELTRDDPGVEVDLLLEGAAATGDYYGFTAEGGGTTVIKRTVVELPYVLALTGAMFMVKGEAPAAQQRRINEVQALKTAFEANNEDVRPGA
jgi:hypothetical protein